MTTAPFTHHSPRSMKRHTLLFVLAVCSLASVPATATAGPAAVATKQLLRWFAKESGEKGAKELAEIGGREGLETILERAAKEGVVDLAVVVAKKQGPAALRAAASDPRVLLPAIRELPEALAERGVAALLRDADRLTPLIKKYGPDVLEAEAKHPGVAAKLIAQFGDDGVDAVKAAASTDDVIALARWADEIGALPPRVRGGVLDAFAKAPEKVAAELARPGFVLSAGGAGALMIAAGYTPEAVDRIVEELGGGEVTRTGPDGTTTTEPAWVSVVRPTFWASGIGLLVVAVALAVGLLRRLPKKAATPE